MLIVDKHRKFIYWLSLSAYNCVNLTPPGVKPKPLYNQLICTTVSFLNVKGHTNVYFLLLELHPHFIVPPSSPFQVILFTKFLLNHQLGTSLYILGRHYWMESAQLKIEVFHLLSMCCVHTCIVNYMWTNWCVVIIVMFMLNFILLSYQKLQLS